MTCNVFFLINNSERWIDLIERHQKDKLSTKTVSNFKVWFEYLERPDDPANARYRCRICHKYYDNMGFPKNRKPAVALTSGVLFDSKKRNQEVLSDHDKSRSHMNVISNLEERAAKKPYSRSTEENTEENKYFEVTARVITLELFMLLIS